MTIFSSLDLAEQARQLSNPEGSAGLAVAEWLNGNNRESVARALSLLELTTGCTVLEIGFGKLGRGFQGQQLRRHVVEKLAKHCDHTEVAVAEHALALALENRDLAAGGLDERTRHVGY